MLHYILNEKGEPVAEPNILKWSQWLNKGESQVAVEQIGGSRVSTVFLAINHRMGGGPPILWETMVFGGKLNGEQDRCAGSREQAEAMHAGMVERVKSGVRC